MFERGSGSGAVVRSPPSFEVNVASRSAEAMDVGSNESRRRVGQTGTSSGADGGSDGASDKIGPTVVSLGSASAAATASEIRRAGDASSLADMFDTSGVNTARNCPKNARF